MATSRTKIVGYLLIVVALATTTVDLLNGDGFDISMHIDELITALGGAGLIFLRDAIARIK